MATDAPFEAIAPNDAGLDAEASTTDAPVSMEDAQTDASTDSSTMDAGDASPNDAGACSSTMALLAMGTSAAAEAHFANGQWAIAALVAQGGAAPPAQPNLVPYATGFLGAFVTSGSTMTPLDWTAYTGSWTSPAQVAAATAQGTPALAMMGSAAHAVYWGSDGKFYHGIFTGSWNMANDAVENDGGAQSFGSSAPAAAVVGSTLVVAQAGSSGLLYDQSWTAGAWQPASAHNDALLVTTIAPTMVALQGSAADLMVVFIGASDAHDYHLEYTTRTGGTWSAAADVYNVGSTLAYSGFRPALAALPNGGAVVVWLGNTPSSPYASVYDGTQWSVPAQVSTATLASAPAVATGVCGATAAAAYVDSTGQVAVATLSGGSWQTPTSINGAIGMASVSIASAP